MLIEGKKYYPYNTWVQKQLLSTINMHMGVTLLSAFNPRNLLKPTCVFTSKLLCMEIYAKQWIIPRRIASGDVGIASVHHTFMSNTYLVNRWGNFKITRHTGFPCRDDVQTCMFHPCWFTVNVTLIIIVP